MSEREEAINKLLNIFSPGKFISWGVEDVSVPGVSFFSAGGACPVQAEGKYKDYNFYFRYRWGTASLSLSKEDPVANKDFYEVEPVGDSLDGFLTKEEFVVIFSELLGRIDREIKNGS